MTDPTSPIESRFEIKIPTISTPEPSPIDTRIVISPAEIITEDFDLINSTNHYEELLTSYIDSLNNFASQFGFSNNAPDTIPEKYPALNSIQSYGRPTFMAHTKINELTNQIKSEPYFDSSYTQSLEDRIKELQAKLQKGWLSRLLKRTSNNPATIEAKNELSFAMNSLSAIESRMRTSQQNKLMWSNTVSKISREESEILDKRDAVLDSVDTSSGAIFVENGLQIKVSKPTTWQEASQLQDTLHESLADLESQQTDNKRNRTVILTKKALIWLSCAEIVLFNTAAKKPA